jgi:hypothetical protein
MIVAHSDGASIPTTVLIDEGDETRLGLEKLKKVSVAKSATISIFCVIISGLLLPYIGLLFEMVCELFTGHKLYGLNKLDSEIYVYTLVRVKHNF